jgi:DNA-binding winged helix-turn-helix (wHTH) protein
VLPGWRILPGPRDRLLRHGDVPVALSPKAFDALVYLARNSGRLLTRDELIQALWPDSYVEEGNLSVASAYVIVSVS